MTSHSCRLAMASFASKATIMSEQERCCSVTSNLQSAQPFRGELPYMQLRTTSAFWPRHIRMQTVGVLSMVGFESDAEWSSGLRPLSYPVHPSTTASPSAQCRSYVCPFRARVSTSGFRPDGCASGLRTQPECRSSNRKPCRLNRPVKQSVAFDQYIWPFGMQLRGLRSRCRVSSPPLCCGGWSV